MKKQHVMLIVLFVTVLQIRLFGQTYNMGAAGARTVIGCNLTIYDNGGTSAYGNNRNDTMTILSGTPSTPSVKITIQEADIASDDSLFIYNSNTADPSKLIYLGPLNAPFLSNNNMIILGNWSTYSTIDNPSGAITLRFKSNGVNIGAGFKISVSCQPTCQRINAYLDTLATTPMPHRLVPDDGYQYIDVCENQPVHLVGNAHFQDNDVVYHQTLDSCVFFWKLGNQSEFSTPIGANSINHTFSPIRGYNVSFYLKDQKQCVNFNSTGIRIRTSASPIGHLNALDSICQGTPSQITFGYNDSSNIVFRPVGIDAFSINGANMTFDSAMYIPDGDNCPGMPACFNASVNFNSFAPGAVISSATDILSICFTMEHSYLGDLQFKFICPNGQSVITHLQPNGSGLYLGVPIDGSNSCDASPLQRGIGWNYCWSENPTYSYHSDTSATHYLHQNQTIRCDSSNRSNHTNYYKPMNSFNGLIGCPLNGTWAVEICDLWSVDDGWIFQWQLNLDPSLLPTPWIYNVGIDQILWSGSSISEVNDSSVVVTPTQSGLNSSLFTITDEFGCMYDSLINIYAYNSPNSEFTYSVIDTLQVLFNSFSFDAINYLWDFGVGNNTSTEANPLFNYPSPGQYTVIHTTSNGTCTSSTTQVISVSNTGINEENSESINIYPIPTSDKITIQVGIQNMGITRLNIFDMTGKEVFSKVITVLDSDNSLELDLSSLVSGVYHVQLKNETNVANKMILIKR